MDERTAAQVLALQAYEEAAPDSPLWTPEDHAWATRAALDAGAPSLSAFVARRARLAWQRLGARDAVLAAFCQPRRWPWAASALALGLVLGLLADAVGSARRIDLLAPPVWVVVVWNLAVYVFLAWAAWRGRAQASAWVERMRMLLWPALPQGQGAAHRAFAAAWSGVALPLWRGRAAAWVHLLAAALGLGMLAGLYLRGLVLDYRASWESTFLGAEVVAAWLQATLAPAAWLTGQAVPDVRAVEALRLQPGSAEVWIHLYAATLLLVVVGPRLGLALWHGLRAQWAAQRIVLPLEQAYFQSLNQAWLAGGATAEQLGITVAVAGDSAAQVQALLGRLLQRTPEPGAAVVLSTPQGQVLRLLAAPACADTARLSQRLQQLGSVWRRPFLLLHDALLEPAFRAEQRAWQQLGRQADVLLWLHAQPQQAQQGQHVKQAGLQVLPWSQVPPCWLQERALWQAVHAALPPLRQAVMAALLQVWDQRAQARFDSTIEALQACLDDAAALQVRVDEPRGLRGAIQGLMGRADDITPLARAQAQLAEQLRARAQVAIARLAALHGVHGQAGVQLAERLAAQGRLQARVNEGKAAVWGGVVSGALAGLKADIATGGLTLGGGALAGGVLGALGAAGVARGANLWRDTEQALLRLDAQGLAEVRAELLLCYLALAHAGQDAQPDSGAQCTAAWQAAVAQAQDVPSLREAALQTLRSLYPDAAFATPALTSPP